MKDEQNGGGIFRNIRRAFGFKPQQDHLQNKKISIQGSKAWTLEHI